MFMNVNQKDLQHLLHPTTRVSLLPQVSRQMHPAPRVDSQAKRCFQRDGTMGQQKNHGLFDFEISKENCGKKNKETIYEVQISQVKDSFYLPISTSFQQRETC